MKKLVVSIHDSRLADYILVDGKNLLFKKDKDNDRFVATYETNRDSVVLASDTFHPYLQEGWWIKNMALFLLSGFGIFAPRYMPKMIYHYVGNVKLGEGDTKIEVKWGWSEETWTVEGADITVSDNSKFADPRIRKRKRALGWCKFLAVLVVFGLLFLIIRAVVK